MKNDLDAATFVNQIFWESVIRVEHDHFHSVIHASIFIAIISINFFETKMNILGNKFNVFKYFNKVSLALRISNWCKDIQTFKETILIM